MSGWVTTRQLAELSDVSVNVIKSRVFRGAYTMIRQDRRSHGGKRYFRYININDPAISDSAREKYFAQANNHRTGAILSTVEAMKRSLNKLSREVRTFNLAFNQFADLFCRLYENQDETTR